MPVVKSTKLTPNAKIIYGLYLWRAGEKGVCWNGIRDIQVHSGIKSRSTILKAIKELQDLGVIHIIPGKGTRANTTIVKSYYDNGGQQLHFGFLKASFFFLKKEGYEEGFLREIGLSA